MKPEASGAFPPPLPEVLIVEVTASPETFPPVRREASRKYATGEALAHLDAALTLLRARGHRILGRAVDFPVAVVEVRGDGWAEGMVGVAFHRLSVCPDPTFEDTVALRLGGAVWAALPWLARWLENWPRRSPTEAELNAAAEHFARGVDARESAAAIAEGRML